MKKTISINISGLNFLIEEEAYSKLQNYLDDVRKHCGSDTDVEEVISDIESGISEKLKQQITPYKEVITTKDIEDLIKIMGTTEDFDREVGQISQSRSSDSKTKRKLYRDTEDFVIGGVAGGLGVYFEIDPVIFRIIFILLTLASGFGILAYIVLWVAMPEAKTANQKLEMRGEAPTVAAFENLSKMEKKIKKNFKERWNKFPTVGKVLSIPILVFNSLLNILKKIILRIGPILKFIIGLILVIISLIVLGVVGVGSLYMLLQTHSVYSFAFIPIAELIKIIPFTWLVITGFFSLAIPFILLLVGGIALLRKKRFLSFNFGLILVGIWMIAGISFCALCLRYFPDVVYRVKNYSELQTISKVVDISDVNKIIVNGPYINVVVNKNNNDETLVSGRKVDIDSLEIIKENKDIFLTWKEKTNDLCFNCSHNSVQLIISKEKMLKIKMENGAKILE